MFSVIYIQYLGIAHYDFRGGVSEFPIVYIRGCFTFPTVVTISTRAPNFSRNTDERFGSSRLKRKTITSFFISFGYREYGRDK